MTGLYQLRDFFKPGRKPGGTYMGENEDMVNATWRNLSTLSETELLSLRDAARQFADMCEEECHSRYDCCDQEMQCVGLYSGERAYQCTTCLSVAYAKDGAVRFEESPA